MISYEEALKIIEQSAESLKEVTVGISESLGMVCAEDVRSKTQVSPFDNSAMDGFAIVSEDTSAANTNNPITIKVVGSTVAGDKPSSKKAGQAWEIMTGAPIPEGYNTVVKIEDVAITKKCQQGRPEEISINQPIAKNNNIRRAGEDFNIEDLVIEKGTKITSFHIMALATIGQPQVKVFQKPRVTIVSTGKEIVDDFTVTLQAGQIWNSNSPFLASELAEMDCLTNYAGIIYDEPDIFEERIESLLQKSDIIISTGAVSMGRHDFIPESLKKLGAEIKFHKVAIRPGKPILYAKFPDGTHYFGLPGNPVSAAVGLRFFVSPLLRKIQKMGFELPITARLLVPSPKKQGLRFFRKAYASVATGGKLQVEILKGQESFKIHPLLKANCWASFTAKQTGLEMGETIKIYPLTTSRWNLENASWKN